jgi:hypothetical protein
MKINEQKNKIKLSKKEWERIGKEAGWSPFGGKTDPKTGLTPEDMAHIIDRPSQKSERDPALENGKFYIFGKNEIDKLRSIEPNLTVLDDGKMVHIHMDDNEALAIFPNDDGGFGYSVYTKQTGGYGREFKLENFNQVLKLVRNTERRRRG